MQSSLDPLVWLNNGATVSGQPWADAIVDVGSHPVMGLASNLTNGAYWQSDQTHPTYAGYGLYAPNVANAVKMLTARYSAIVGPALDMLAPRMFFGL